jgi:hypothetical protein
MLPRLNFPMTEETSPKKQSAQSNSWIPQYYKGRPTIHRSSVEQCRKISIPSLLKNKDYGQHHLQFGMAYLSDEGASYLQIGQYQFKLEQTAGTLGGGYWLVRCPLTKKLRWHLFVDLDGNVGTRDSLDLTYVSRRMIPRKRRTWNKVKVWAAMHGEGGTPDLEWFETHPDSVPLRPNWWVDNKGNYHPRRMRKKRYERLLRKLSRTRRLRKQIRGAYS